MLSFIENEEKFGYLNKTVKHQLTSFNVSKNNDFKEDMLENLNNSDDENDDLMSNRRSLFQSIIDTNKEEIIGQDLLDEISDSSDEEFQARQSYLSLRDSSAIKEIQRMTQPKSRFKKNATIMELVESENKAMIGVVDSYGIDHKKFLIPEKDQKRMSYENLRISEQIFESDISDHKGLPFWIKKYEKYIFIGISQGIIRVFDIKTNEELKSLVPKKLKSTINRVLCMDVSLSGNQLIAGYESGKIVLFDIFKQKVIIEVDDLFKSEVHHIKFLSNLEKMNVVCWDKRGYAYKLVLNKSLLKFSCKSERISEKVIPGICSIAALQPKEGMPIEVIEWQSYNITAVSSTESVTVFLLGNPIHILYGLSRTEFGKDYIKPDSLWYLDWGYGITPTISRESSKWLLAIAWDKVLQIWILENPEYGLSSIRPDGYYLSDYPIDWVQFLSDSVVMILVNKKEVRILFIPDFWPYSFVEEGLKIKQKEDEKNPMNDKSRKAMFRISLGEDFLRELSMKAEIEKGTRILDGNIKYLVTSDKQNFCNSIVTYENNLIVLGQSDILSAELFYWEKYLYYIQNNYGWLVCLKAALDIYNGDLKGFYGVPYIAHERQSALIDKLKQLVLQGINLMIQSFYGNRNKEVLDDGNVENDNSVIKVTIEFCNEIKSSDFLFTTIFDEFARQGYEDKFVENLEQFILIGYFKEYILPSPVLKRVWDYYLEQRKYIVLARIVSWLNFSEYEYLEELKAICMFK